MSSLLDHLPRPEPDVARLKAVLRREVPDRVPLIELAMADEVLAALKGSPLTPLPAGGDAQDLRPWAEDRVRLWHRLGYDYFRVRAEMPFKTSQLATKDTAQLAAGDRQWVDEHAGVIHSMADVESYPWLKPADVGFAQAEAAIRCLPDGMEAIGFSGGVLEWASTIMGLESFMMALYEEPELVRAVTERVGEVIYKAFETFCGMDRVFAIWLGDDMGFKTSTLISPEHLREFILPWHRRFAELAHRTGRLFILHSCGHIEAVMPDLIETVGIDGKHSFEDIITPVEQFKKTWGGRVAVLGGVDVDLLSRASVERVRARTQQILEACAPGGGYACGSGNSVTNYTRPKNYLAMVETVQRFNGRM
jgi:uroporphyrinogen decarboxylase